MSLFDTPTTSPTTSAATSPCACQCGCRTPVTLTPAHTRGRWPLTPYCADCFTHDQDDTSNTTVIDQWTHPAVRHQWAQQWARTVPPMYRDAHLDPDTVTAMQRACLDRAPQGMVISGPLGSGKTHRGYAILNTLVALGYSHPSHIIAGRESDLLLEAAYGTWTGKAAARARLSDPRLAAALIDDTGHAPWRTSEERWSHWADLTDRLLNNNGCLIVTTNLEPDQLKNWIGAPALSRLRALTGGNAHILNDRNYRDELFITNT